MITLEQYKHLVSSKICLYAEAVCIYSTADARHEKP